VLTGQRYGDTPTSVIANWTEAKRDVGNAYTVVGVNTLLSAYTLVSPAKPIVIEAVVPDVGTTDGLILYLIWPLGLLVGDASPPETTDQSAVSPDETTSPCVAPEGTIPLPPANATVHNATCPTVMMLEPFSVTVCEHEVGNV
jgi:hypothetical protein